MSGMMVKYKEVQVLEDTHSIVNRLKVKLGMTQDGLIKHLTLFYLEESQDQRLHDFKF